jgi:ketosteroid isomerase-like protein
MTDPLIAAVQRAYEAFARGDLEAVLVDIDDDVLWEAVPSSDAAPWYGTYRGKGEVPQFFKEIGTNVEVTEFAPVSFTTSDTDVVAVVRWGFRALATGRQVVTEIVHLFRFTGDKVTYVRTWEDTAEAAAALR